MITVMAFGIGTVFGAIVGAILTVIIIAGDDRR